MPRVAAWGPCGSSDIGGLSPITYRKDTSGSGSDSLTLVASSHSRKDPTPGVSQQGGTMRWGDDAMGYTRAQVRTALAKAREDGRSTSGMAPDLRETELQLERWGLLPLPNDDSADKRIADWYASQGLAMRLDPEAPPRKAAAAEEVVIMSAPGNDAALVAAEAALAAAQAALAYARSIMPPAA